MATSPYRADPVGLADLLAETLAARGALSTRDLLVEVRRAGGHGVSRARLERILASDARFGACGERGKPRWCLTVDPDPAGTSPTRAEDQPPGSNAVADGVVQDNAEVPISTTRARLDAMALRPWQAEALAAWSATGRGVIEAVTGTGKTRLALAAIRMVSDRSARALVLVPTLELQDQWVREVRAAMPDLRVGRLGGGHDDDLFACDVVVATPHSAATVPVDLPPQTVGLLVADEAHRYGAPTWAAALSESFALRLALTATYERGDDGIVEVLEPYFGELTYRYGYDRAVADGTVAPFRIALVGVELEPAEREAYDAADTRVRQLHRELVGGLRMPRDPKELFAAVAAVVAEAERSGNAGPQSRTCREYLMRVRERRDIAATASAKLDVCRAVGPVLRGRRSLVFTDTVEQADQAARVLTGLRPDPPSAETIHGGLTAQRRRIRLASFRRGDLDVVVAPRVLDEGVDVPAADLAVVLAAFRTRRQMVQRLGRVLRVKRDGREARLVIAHALGTSEDPAVGGHRDFLGDVRSVARRVDRFTLPRERRELADWVVE
jgi:superfamily II DNA or RNA helicase